MSKYGWESGTIKLPSTQYSSFGKALRNSVAEAIERDYAKLKKIQATVRETKLAVNAVVPKYEELLSNAKFEIFEDYMVLDASIDETKSGKSAIKNVSKSVFIKELGYSKENNSISNTHGTVTFVPGAKAVCWNVPENNRAVEDARSSFLGKTFFSLLSKVKWSRNTGGVFSGNDEYNRDNDAPGGGGNYVTLRVGPIGEEDKERTTRMLSAQIKRITGGRSVSKARVVARTAYK